MLHRKTIDTSTLELLRKLQSLPELSQTRLVGGTALALQLGHRKSIDLDFFGQMDTSLDELSFIISAFAQVKPIASSRMMRFLIVNDVKVDIVSYPYPWLEDPVQEEGIVLAGIKDIAAMKLSAITNRGTRKDFVDLYYLLQHYTLRELIGFYKSKYSDSQFFTVIKSLTYFDDAEKDPMPTMLRSADWDVIKQKITAEIRKTNGDF